MIMRYSWAHPSGNTNRLQAIQVLRGIACLFVIWCHTDYARGFGQTGVDIFVVVSGYVTMLSTEKTSNGFLWRRIKKIVPLYWLMTAFTAMCVLLVPFLFRSYEVNLPYFLKSLFFIPYEHHGIRQPILGLGWTLNYEMLFYVLVCAAMKISVCREGLVLGC